MNPRNSPPPSGYASAWEEVRFGGMKVEYHGTVSCDQLISDYEMQQLNCAKSHVNRTNRHTRYLSSVTACRVAVESTTNELSASAAGAFKLFSSCVVVLVSMTNCAAATKAFAGRWWLVSAAGVTS